MRQLIIFIVAITSVFNAFAQGVPPVGETIALKKASTQEYVTVDESNSNRLEANSETATTNNEKFVVEQVLNVVTGEPISGVFGLRSLFNNNYVKYDPTRGSILFPDSATLNDVPEAHFEWIVVGGEVEIIATKKAGNNKVKVAGGQRVLRADAAAGNTSGRFEWESLSQPTTQPNVLFILADDLGYADISLNKSAGSYAHTPNIDKIFQEGINLTNYTTHHVCTPTRAGILTGKHYTRVGSGLETNGTLDNSIPNIAKDFQAAGYSTGVFGKWHSSEPPFPSNTVGGQPAGRKLTDDEKDALGDSVLTNGIFDYTHNEPWGEGVNAYGFDKFIGFYSGGGDFFNTYTNYYDDLNWWIDSEYRPDETGYVTDRIKNSTIKFIEDSVSNNKPFFCYMSHGAVHLPVHVKREDLIAMCNIVDDEHPELSWANVQELVSPRTGNRVGDVAEIRCSRGDEFGYINMDQQYPGFKKLVYYTMAYSMDNSIKEVLDKIDELGVKNNTIVIFTSDNGGLLYDGLADNSPYSEGKHRVKEGGVRVPTAIWHPGNLDANTGPYTPADNSYNFLTQYLDWYPTLMSLTGVTINGTDLDGIDLKNSLKNRTQARAEFQNCYYGLGREYCAIKSNKWKLLYNQLSGNNRVVELYDLENDAAESINLVADYPAERDELIRLANEWFGSGEVSTTYMSTPFPNTNPQPAGDVLKFTATQSSALSSQGGVWMSFAAPQYVNDGNEYNNYFHADDVLEYDIYVAASSDQTSGFFAAPSRRLRVPAISDERGVHSSGVMLNDYTFPVGQWVRVSVGAGDILSSTAEPIMIGLHNPNSGDYHFYVDNVVIRKSDGGVRAFVWQDSSDTVSYEEYYFDGEQYLSLSDVSGAAGFPLTGSGIDMESVSLSSVPGYDANDHVVRFDNPLNEGVLCSSEDTVVTVSATDDSGIIEVRLFTQSEAQALSGEWTYRGAVTSIPYQWNLGLLDEGSYTFRAISVANAIDPGTGENEEVTQRVDVIVEECDLYPSLPKVSFDEPTGGSPLCNDQDVVVKITATDDGGINRVALHVFDYATEVWEFQGEDYSEPYEWNLGTLTSGTYQLRAFAFSNDLTPEGSNQIGDQSLDIVVEDCGPGGPPTISFESPTPPDGATLCNDQVISIRTSASDDSGIIRVNMFSRKGSSPWVYEGAVFTPPYQLDIGPLEEGSYVIRAIAIANDIDPATGTNERTNVDLNVTIEDCATP